jgi:hypothetical protein
MINIVVIIYGTTRLLKKRLWNLSVSRGNRSGILQSGFRLIETKITCVLEPTVRFRDFFLFSVDLVMSRNPKWSQSCTRTLTHRSVVKLGMQYFQNLEHNRFRFAILFFNFAQRFSDLGICNHFNSCALFTVSVLSLNVCIYVPNMICLYFCYIINVLNVIMWISSKFKI